MTTLKDIVSGLTNSEIIGTDNIKVNAVHFDSRKVQSNDVFVAVPGTQVDGHRFIPDVIEKGATTIVCQQKPEVFNPKVTYILVDDSAEALAKMASAYYGHPSKQLKLVGITGTNGKTTSVTLLYQLFQKLGYKSGLISTISNFINDVKVEATHTTPDPLQLNKLLADMVATGCDYCFMEVSSHAAHQKRIAGLEFAGGVFTNITQDHLDYHETFAEYIKAKKLFFDALPKHAFALVNGDDKNGRIMLQNTKASRNTFGLASMADFMGEIIEKRFDGMLLMFEDIEFWTSFIGGFNAYNLLTVYAVARLLDKNKQEVAQYLSILKPVDGRFQTIKSKEGKMAIVDYAHTPDALENVLTTVQEIREGEGSIITVVGAGGNRDKTKRPIMAAIAAKKSDKVILTSDNPRNEEPETIIDDMKKGVLPPLTNKLLSITDRREAIRTACMLAQPGDIVLVAGKGHETYQEVNGVRHHFDDREIINEIFETA